MLALWYVKNAASSSLLPFLGRPAELEGIGKLEGGKGCLLREPSSPSLRAPYPRSWVLIATAPMGQRRFHHLLFHSFWQGGKRENKTLKITVSLLKKEKLSCRPPPTHTRRSRPSLPPPPPTPPRLAGHMSASYNTEPHGSSWAPNPTRTDRKPTAVGRSARNRLQRGRPGDCSTEMKG